VLHWQHYHRPISAETLTIATVGPSSDTAGTSGVLPAQRHPRRGQRRPPRLPLVTRPGAPAVVSIEAAGRDLRSRSRVSDSEGHAQISPGSGRRSIPPPPRWPRPRRGRRT
jgi:hypothetical protein